MKAVFCCITFLAVPVSLLSSAQAVSAQTFDAQPSYQAAGLRTMVKAQPNSALVRVRYESNNPGPVQVELRNDRGRVVYTERKRETHFVGNYDLALLPAGDYTLQLSTCGFHHVEALRLYRTNSAIATIQVIELNAFRVSSPSLFTSAIAN